MKNILLVMLSLGLVLAFSASAMAVDVKFSGSYYAAGIYLDKVTLRDTLYGVPADSYSGVSTAFYYQRLRVQTDFIVSPGLKLVTRFDAMERIWGGARSATDTESHLKLAEQENIRFEYAYIDYVSPVGTFDVGYQKCLTWGTDFNDSNTWRPAIAWNYKAGSWNVGTKVEKVSDKSYSYVETTRTQTDIDSDRYLAFVIYSWQDGSAGLQAVYSRDATNRKKENVTPPGYLNTSYTLQPYVKAKFGPVQIQAELDYLWGDSKDYESGETDLHDISQYGLGLFVDAVADFGKVYAGGSFAYVSGDDPGTTDKIEGGSITGGSDWNPCLIMYNDERNTWVGALRGWDSTSNANAMSNVWFFQGRVGVRPIEALDIKASVSFATADRKPAYPASGFAANTGVLENEYGWEADITGTYKITNNLSYMLGAGYLWTGDYYHGINNRQGITDNYLLVNKLTLTF